MKREDIERVIAEIDKSVNEDKSIIGLYESFQQKEHLYLKGNRDGLLLLTKQLLLSSLDFKENEINLRNLDLFLDDKEWYDSESLLLSHFEQTEFGVVKQTDFNQFSYKDTLFKYGCLTTIVLILVSIFVGIQTIFHWFYK